LSGKRWRTRALSATRFSKELASLKDGMEVEGEGEKRGGGGRENAAAALGSPADPPLARPQEPAGRRCAAVDVSGKG
jgi:hypothetical protein